MLKLKYDLSSSKYELSQGTLQINSLRITTISELFEPNTFVQKSQIMN